jgi:hypothetical protein
MDDLLDPVGIIECYQRWCAKSAVAKKKGEGPHLWASCPFSHHADRDPSCHITPENETDDGVGLWFCFPCGVGGDKYDLVAAALGYDLDSVHRSGDPTFYQVRKRMAEDLGWQEAEFDPKGNSLLRKVSEQEAEDEAPEESEPSSATVTELYPSGESPEPPRVELNWRELVPAGTPLHEWMHATTVTDIPDEYLLWLGFTAVSFSAGRNVYFIDEPFIYPSLFTLFFGSSGAGKSRGIRLLKRLLSDAMPYEYENPTSKGVLLAGTPGSGEAIPHAYARPITDEDGKNTVTTNVRAMWVIDELAGLISRAGRAGSTIDITLIELYDTNDQIVHRLASRTLIGEAPFACALAGTQPQVIGKFVTLDHVWSGFLNRWMPVIGTKKKRQVLNRVAVDLDAPRTAFNTLWREHQNKVTPLRLDQGEASRVWLEFNDEFIDPLLQDEENTMASAYIRIELLMRKLMIIFAINERQTSINLDIVQRVVSMFPYIKGCYDSMTGRIVVSAADDCGDRMINLLRDYGKPITASAFWRKVDKWSRFERSQKLRAFEELQRMRIIIESDTPKSAKGGRPGKQYALSADDDQAPGTSLSTNSAETSNGT